MKVGIYVRVSTQQQTTDNQLLDLYEVCERNDWTVVEEYNETISGTKGATDRKELNRMLKDASRKKFDKLVVWSVDRVGRSMKHLVGGKTIQRVNFFNFEKLICIKDSK